LPTLDSTLAVGSIGSTSSAAILQSKLSRYEVQLADWCHCPSGTTPDGKRKIADLQAKADATKAQLEEVHAARSQQKVAAATATTDSAPTRVYSTLGSLIDVVV
jgi:hypothetical protein